MFVRTADLEPHPRPTKSETELDPRLCVLTSTVGDFSHIEIWEQMIEGAAYRSIFCTPVPPIGGAPDNCQVRWLLNPAMISVLGFLPFWW